VSRLYGAANLSLRKRNFLKERGAMRMKKLYFSFVALITFVENLLCAFGIIFATAFTVIQIVNRYWLHFEIMWISDLVLYVFVRAAIISIAITTREDAHTAVDVFMERIFRGKKAFKVSKILINFASLGIIWLIMPIFYAYFLRALKFDEWGTLVPWFNTSWLVEAIFVMFVLCVFHIIHNTVIHMIDLYRLFGGGEE
jgi:C4-dicarboxylate transporter DctQ subunit